MTCERSGIEQIGNGYGYSLTFRRDGTAERSEDKRRSGVLKEERLSRVNLTAEQFDRLAGVVANHFFAENSNKGVPTDSSDCISVATSYTKGKRITMYLPIPASTPSSTP
ncbi:MAG: hypothetical protein ABI999_12145 [Acidobacteriota bacterium]